MKPHLQQQAVSKVPAWFGRKFEFTFPVEQYPSLCVRLRGTPARLEEMLRGISRDALIAKRADKWSVQEHAGHLLDLEQLWTTRVDDFLKGGDTLSVADLSNRKTYEANHNARQLVALLAEFRAARFQLIDLVEKFDPALFARSMLHPRLQKPMRLVDHLYFVAEHDDHHLATIWEMISG
ncbi:MAG TPA: DinB family protein [Terriglobales bacterium]|nr:DinB family protein [Terriglobales bacterium]